MGEKRQDMEKIIIEVDGKKIEVEKGANLLDILLKNHFSIPHLCYHPDFKPEESCRMCLVEVNGRIKTSCGVKVNKGLVISTATDKIKRLRKTNALLIANSRSRRQVREGFNFEGIINYDMRKCIDCSNCIRACAFQGVSAVKMNKYGFNQQVAKTENKCVYCGQCLTHCPTGTISTNENEYKRISKIMDDKNIIKIAQIAPSIRVAIGEEFGIAHGEVVTGKLVAALKKVGFDYVFDTSFGADMTTVEEAKELIYRLKNNKKLPMFSSCCPGWVRYVLVYYPEFESLLTTALPPEIIMGNIIKHYFSKKIKVDIKKIQVISIMPCTAKKWEVKRKEFMVDGYYPVDDTLTTSETARLIKENNIDFKNLKGQSFDNPLGDASGAGIIFGVTGGVMIAALRTAYNLLTSKNPENLNFREEITRLEGLKILNIELPGKTLRIAVIDGLGNFKSIANRLQDFDYIEVMACPGGCIGGGGQPKPIDNKIRELREKGLLGIDQGLKIRLAHENPLVKKLYQEFLVDEATIKKYCHYHPR